MTIDFRERIRRLYDETLAGDFSCVSEFFHAKYRSLTESGEDSPKAFIEGTKSLLDMYEIVDRTVLFTLGDEEHVGIVQHVKLRTRGRQSRLEQSLRADFYRIEDGQFIEHWGIPPL